MRLVGISNGPLPYHTPIFNQLARMCELEIVYMAASHPLGSFADLWGEIPRYKHAFDRSLAITWRRSDFRTQLSLGVSRRLARTGPDVIFFSSWGPLVWEPIAWARRRGTGTVMWAESTAGSGLARGAIANRLRRIVISTVDAFVSNGSQATRYLRDLGARSEQIVTGCLPSGLVTSPERPQKERPQKCGGPSFVFAGRLVPIKRPLDVVGAFRHVLQVHPQASLTLIGDGPQASELQAVSSAFPKAIRLRGRLEGHALRAAFAEADVLVLPSEREVWGLVVNEALMSGLAVVVSDGVGSAYDLVTEENGVIFPAGDQDALTHAMLRAAALPHVSAERARRAATVSHCTPEAFARDILRAARLARAAAAT